MDTDSRERDYEYTTLMNMLRVSVSKHLLNEHFSLVWANDFYYELIGYTKEEYEILYHNQCDSYYSNDELGIHDEEDWERLGGVVTKALEEGRSGYSNIGRIRKKNGEYALVQMTATFVDDYIDGCQVSYTAMTDVTDIIQQQREQSVTYDNLPGFVAKCRVGGEQGMELLEANSRFYDFFGEGDALFRENLKQNADVVELYRKKFQSREAVHFVARCINRDGKEAWLQVNAACLDSLGEEPLYLFLFIDITNETELRQMQEKLEKQAQELKTALRLAERANRAKSDFLSHMSHDIRTPMNAIVGMTDIAKSHLNEPDKILDCLNKITLSGQHLLGLINDVLDMSKIENGNISISNMPLSLPELLTNVVTITQPNIKARNQKFAVRLHDLRHERYCSDALRLRQILINLLSNASKFTPSGGSVTMDIAERAGEDALSVYLDIVITDTGIGMSQDFMEHIFEPFSREQDSRVDKTEGSGLGMAITKRLVELLGGSIRVASSAGEGSTFSVSVPMQLDNMPPMPLRFPELKILVVDDGEDILEYMEQALREFGVIAECTESGAEAVSRVGEARRKGADYDAVILDWKMPGMDGLQTARQIRKENGGDIPILIMSAYDWSEIEEPAKEAGITGFLQKPIFLSTLCYGIQKYVLGQDVVQDELPTYDFTGKHILLVEDNELNREIARELLQQTGAAVDVAGDGKAGVEAFENSMEAFYDLILMDIRMPVMDGLRASRKIRRLSRKDAAGIPVIAMTADAFAEDVAAARQAGMNDHIAKPIDVQQLYRLIARFIS